MSHVDAQLDLIVVAYDIDGALTMEEGREEFLEDAGTKRVVTGILSARSERLTEHFLSQHPDIQENADFTVSSRIKVEGLNRIKNDYPLADRYIYKGSWARDRVASFISGWEYQQI